MIRGVAILIVGGLLSAGCLDDLRLEEETFPCRVATDCVQGFVCHPERYVCVMAGEVDVDAGSVDGG